MIRVKVKVKVRVRIRVVQHTEHSANEGPGEAGWKTTEFWSRQSRIHNIVCKRCNMALSLDLEGSYSTCTAYYSLWAKIFVAQGGNTSPVRQHR